jgi:hypothetical protein
MNEFIGHDGYHYKIINNRIFKIEHKVTRQKYRRELYNLERLPRNYYFPFLKNFERSNNIQPIRINIIKNEKCNCLFNNFLIRVLS